MQFVLKSSLAFLFLALPSSINALDSRNAGSPEIISETDKPGLLLEDIFGRTINAQGLTLVDWEGYIANPAIKFYLTPPPDAVFPAKAVLTAKEPRLHFDLPSTTSANGPRKEIVWQKREKIPVHISIFPDRDGDDEEYQLSIDFTDAKGNKERLNLPVRVIDQDLKRAEDFRITVDFSQDHTGFFADEGKRAIIVQAANDWSYFFADMKLQTVPARSEKTLIWGPDGFKKESQVLNAKEYTGYLLYAYGIRNELQKSDTSNSLFAKSMKRDPAARNIRSGGEPSPYGGFQTSAGKTTALRRSGGVEVEVQGNYNTLGWDASLTDRNWWQATNASDVKNDLYSIVHHEIGHALIFNPRYSPIKRGDTVDDARVRAYLGSKPALSQTDHLEGVIDPESLHGAFGNEYHGRMPRGRWLITKLDLLCAQAIGYELRQTSPFTPLSLTVDKLPKGKIGVLYSAKLQASGGIPFYCWEAIGQLPQGLSLNSFTGVINGMPAHSGVSEFTVRVRDYSEHGKGATKLFRVEIGDNP
jgi:hypothetical protein